MHGCQCFAFLREQGLAHVFEQGYYMPPVIDVFNRHADPDSLAAVVKGLRQRKRNVWVFANNHFEGSAPLTIERLRQRIGK